MKTIVTLLFLTLVYSCANTRQEEKEPTHLKSSLLDSSSAPISGKSAEVDHLIPFDVDHSVSL